jgi:hypothetical protein
LKAANHAAADGAFVRLTIHYDKDNPKPDIQTKYSPVEDTMFLTWAGGWRRFEPGTSRLDRIRSLL